MSNLYISLTAEELIDKITDFYKFTNMNQCADFLSVPREDFRKWIDEDDIDSIIELCEHQGIVNELFSEKRKVKLLREPSTTEAAMNNLANYYSIGHIRELSLKLNIKPETLFEWKTKNQIGLLVDVVAKKDKYALECMFCKKKKESLNINKTILSHAEKKAAISKMDLTTYVENLIINDLKR